MDVKRRLLKFIILCAVLPGVLRAEDFKVGVVLGLSGYGATWAENARLAMELAREELPGAGKIKLLYQDSQSTPKGAVSAYRKLVDEDKVNVVVGDVWAMLTNPLIPLADADKVILISPTVMDQSVKWRSPYFFSFGHKFESLRTPIRTFFKLQSGIKRLGVLSFEDDWNNALIEVLGLEAIAAGVEVTGFKVNDFNPDFRMETAKLKSKAVDSIFTTFRPETVGKRLKELKFSVPVLCSSDTVDALLVRQADKSLLEGGYFLDWAPNADFRESFKRKYGRAPIMEAHNSYEIIRSLSKALGQGGTDLLKSLLSLNYEGAGGEIDFSAAPFVNQSRGNLFRVEGGKIRLVAAE